MDTDIDKITERIIGCGFKVSNGLGAGFLEKVYENALAVEFQIANLNFRQQAQVKVQYKETIVGDYVADAVIVELKATNALQNTHIAQCLNYLRATKLEFCLLLNFGKPKLEIRRLRL